MIWSIVNSLFAVGVTACATYLLLWYFETFNAAERIGLGLMGGSVLMTVPPLVSVPPTPFDDWSPAVLRVGVFLYFAAKAWRRVKHDQANDALVAQAQRWARRRIAQRD